ncbi:MAG: hypothetical protein ACREP8_02000, partial [Candidatus Binatia bacterium]
LELQGWPLESYHAIDLFAYLDALPKEQAGRGDHLILTNVRNEKQFWSRRQIEPYRPVIVIGIDDEKNLFRFAVLYRMQRQYSWKAGAESPVLARPLGAFIYFLKEPPPELQAQSWHYSLTPNSFRLVDKDPLRPIRDLSKEVQEVLTYRNGCVYCHSFRDIGARSHHNAAAAGGMHGGLALPLESYPPEVWKAFLFDQYEVADKIGANPNVVDTSVRKELYDLVAESRKQRRTPAK